MRHVAHKKITNNHTTVTDLSHKIVQLAVKLDSIEKITLGLIKPNLRPAPQRIKAIPIVGGYRLKVRRTTSIQHLFIYTNSLEELNQKLKKRMKLTIKS